MKAMKISKAEMARRLNTSRTRVARFLDPENCSVRLDTMQKAAAIVASESLLSLRIFPIRQPDLIEEATLPPSSLGKGARCPAVARGKVGRRLQQPSC
jgi:hypothetical protein